MLDRIKLRHLLNRAQEMLAIAVGLTNSPFGASLAWREALGSAEDLPTRLEEARALLGRPGISLDRPTLAFVSSPEGLRLAVEAKSSIRLRGDRVAHPVAVARTHLDGPISRHPFPLETPGLRALMDFVCSEYAFPCLIPVRSSAHSGLPLSLGGSSGLDRLHVEGGCCFRPLRTSEPWPWVEPFSFKDLFLPVHWEYMTTT